MLYLKIFRKRKEAAAVRALLGFTLSTTLYIVSNVANQITAFVVERQYVYTKVLY